MTTFTREPITEYLEVDLESESWHCRRCNHRIGSAHEGYKRGLLLYDRDPREIYQARWEGDYTHAPDPQWCRIVECYCPGCSAQVEVEYLPPGHPVSNDIQLDIEALKERQLRQRASEQPGATDAEGASA